MTYETPQIILTEEMIETVIKQIENVKDSKKKRQLIADMQALYRLQQRKKLFSYFPDEGPLRRELYVKHMEFFRAGKEYQERVFLAGNRCGKSFAGCYELTLHLTGLYPDWWEGKRFTRPIKAWAAGDTSNTCKTILQAELLGEVGDFGTGMIPFGNLISTTPKRNVPDAVETIYVKHISGGKSSVSFKSYAESRLSFQGTAQDVILIDEECPMDVYTECLMRTMTTKGIVMVTFTPLSGLTDLVLSFMEEDTKKTAGEKHTKYMIQASWADAPHLSEEDKERFWASLPPHERDARAKGIPSLGSGRIYPVHLDDITVDDFEIPKHFAKSYGLDVGWNTTAAVFTAWDRASDIVYVYSEHVMGQAEPAIHASAIKGRGAWIPGVIDPAARGRSQNDGQQLIELYKNEGLDIKAADNAVEAGIYEVWQRMSTGRLKIFKSCKHLLGELPIYSRKEDGKVEKKRDHACFHYDTEIVTDEGIKKIGEMVGKEGRVLSGDGSFVPFTNCTCTNESAETVKVEFSDKTSVICTPEHPFLTSEGWVEAENLEGKVVLAKGEDCWKLSKLVKQNKSLMVRDIISAASTFKEMVCDYIELFGNIIMAKFPKVIMSTISTRTDQTTTFPTCFSRQTQITWPTTGRVEHMPIPSMCLEGKIKQKHGGIPLKVKHGIKSIMRMLSTYSTRSLTLSVNNAESNLSQSQLGNSAQITANQHGGVTTVWTILRRFVRSVARLLSTTSMEREKTVLSVTRTGKRSAVYNLYVPLTHTFCLSNGVITHNCDALRYNIMSGLKRAKVEVQLRSLPKAKIISSKAWT